MPLEGEGEAVLSRDITRVGLAEGKVSGMSAAEKASLWLKQRLCGEACWGNVGRARNVGEVSYKKLSKAGLGSWGCSWWMV